MTQIRPQTRDALIEAAFQVFSRDPAASLSDVAERAGVGRATLHRHFKGRDDLMIALALTALRELDEAVDQAVTDAPSYGEALRISIKVIIPLADRHSFLAREAVDHDPDVVAHYKEQEKSLVEAIAGAKGEGLFGKEVPTEWIAHAYDYLVYAGWELVRAGDATPAQAAELAWRTLTSGLGGSHDV